MKKYYYTLKKEKKAEIKKIYTKEYKNSDFNLRLKRLTIYTVVGFLFSIYLFIDVFAAETFSIGTLIIAITLLIVSIVFLVGRYLLKLKMLNKIALKNK